ncbi:MAG: RHS repeat-associated core domain-containing protein, partial [Cyanobacteria bacterium J06648_11]
DASDRLTHIREKGALALATYSYDDTSRLSQVSYGNGLAKEFTFYPDHAIETVRHRSLLGQGVDAIWSFGYSAANQLTSETASGLFSWLSGDSGTNVYTANGLNQYSEIDGQAIVYDQNGAISNDGIWSFGYDIGGRLTSANGPGVAASYAYDPLGRRSSKSGSGVTSEQYLSDGAEEIADYDENGVLLRRYVHGKGVDQRLAMYTGTALASKVYYHSDHQGSTVALSDSAGNIVDTFSYGPFGETGVEGTSGNPFRYAGRRIDSETGFYYSRARYYVPELGRFLQPDPIVYGDNMNVYAYVGNDPNTFIDPFGTKAKNYKVAVDNEVARLRKAGHKILSTQTAGKKVYARRDYMWRYTKGREYDVLSEAPNGVIFATEVKWRRDDNNKRKKKKSVLRGVSRTVARRLGGPAGVILGWGDALSLGKQTRFDLEDAGEIITFAGATELAGKSFSEADGEIIVRYVFDSEKGKVDDVNVSRIKNLASTEDVEQVAEEARKLRRLLAEQYPELFGL